MHNTYIVHNDPYEEREIDLNITRVINLETKHTHHLFRDRNIPPRNIPPMKSMHGNNVVWLCAKYAVDPSEANYKPEQRRGGRCHGGTSRTEENA